LAHGMQGAALLELLCETLVCNFAAGNSQALGLQSLLSLDDRMALQVLGGFSVEHALPRSLDLIDDHAIRVGLGLSGRQQVVLEMDLTVMLCLMRAKAQLGLAAHESLLSVLADVRWERCCRCFRPLTEKSRVRKSMRTLSLQVLRLQVSSLRL